MPPHLGEHLQAAEFERRVRFVVTDAVGATVGNAGVVAADRAQLRRDRHHLRETGDERRGRDVELGGDRVGELHRERSGQLRCRLCQPALGEHGGELLLPLSERLQSRDLVLELVQFRAPQLAPQFLDVVVEEIEQAAADGEVVSRRPDAAEERLVGEFGPALGRQRLARPPGRRAADGLRTGVSGVDAEVEERVNAGQRTGHGSVDRLGDDVPSLVVAGAAVDAGEGREASAVVGEHEPGTQAVDDRQPVLPGCERLDVERKRHLLQGHRLRFRALKAGGWKLERQRAGLVKAVAEEDEHHPLGCLVGARLLGGERVEQRREGDAAGAGGNRLQERATGKHGGSLAGWGPERRQSSSVR